MIASQSIERIHLMGLGGAAMAPLAGMLKERGYHVTGSDAGVYPPASTLLEEMGIPWMQGFHEDHLKPPPDLVVVGNVIPRGNPELEYMLDQKIPYASMPEVLGELFLHGHESIVVSGTHGKTTTTSMLAWIFHVAGRRPNFLVGGLAENFGRSYSLAGGEEYILEGDEYDTAYFDKGPKFLHYRPDELIVTSIEFDHADIYADLAAIEVQFRRLVNLVPRRGRIVAWGDPGAEAVSRCVQHAFCPVETYGLCGAAEWTAGDIEFVDGATQFRVVRRGQEAARIRLPLAGRHNVLNALAATALALGRRIGREAVESALETFQGVRRRMQVRGEAGRVIVVDDFAHHPTAIRASLEAARSRWPGRRLWAVFEPRSNTMRRRIFEKQLGEALGTADGIALGPVHHAQLLSDDERLSPERVVAALSSSGKPAGAFQSANAIAKFLVEEAEVGDVVLVMSNGSFDGLCEKLLERLSAGAVSRSGRETK